MFCYFEDCDVKHKCLAPSNGNIGTSIRKYLLSLPFEYPDHTSVNCFEKIFNFFLQYCQLANIILSIYCG